MSDTEMPVEVPKTEEEMAGGKRSAWMAHVKKTMRANKGKSLKDVLKMAGKTYKKGSAKKTARKTRKGKKFLGMFGGAGGSAPTTTEGASEVAATMSGGRRRPGSRKTKGSRRH